MNLDNYKVEMLATVKKVGSSSILLATNDAKAAYEYTKELNKAARIDGRKDVYYVSSIIAYTK